MMDDRDLSVLLDDWFSEGPKEMPDRVVDVVALGISRQRQRPAWRLDWRPAGMSITVKAAAAIAAVAIVVAIVGLSLGGRPTFNGINGATPSPPEHPSTSPAPTATPSASRATSPLHGDGMVVIEHFTAKIGTRIDYLLPDGRSQELLPDIRVEQVAPVWRPDGTTLAFAAAQRSDDQRFGIWTTNAAGASPTPITSDCTPPSCLEEIEPSYSADGRQIVFIRSSGTVTDGPTSTVVAIRDLTTGAVRILDSTTKAIADGEAHHPRLSPDGTHILYHVLQRRSNGDAIESAIFIANADGTGKPTRLAPADLHPSDGEWSHDGSTIVFSSTGIHDWNCCNWSRVHLYRMAADGTGVVQLDTIGSSGAPSWSADGSQILYTFGSDRNGIGVQSINVMNPDGSDDRTIARFGDCCRWYPVQQPPTP